MEIIDFLRIARRRLWVIVLVPLLAGSLALTAMLVRPTLYSSAALVGAPALVGGASTNQFTGAQGVVQYVGAFQSAGTSAVVLQTVADSLDITPIGINSNLVISSVGASSIMRVTFATRDKLLADKVARGVAEETLKYLFGTQVELGEEQVRVAQADLKTIHGELAEIEADAQTLTPDVLYQARQQQVISLQQESLKQQAAGNTSGAAAVTALAAQVQRAINSLAPFAAAHTAAIERRDAVQAVLAVQQQQLAAARYQLAAANPDTVITMTATHPLDETPLILQKVLPAIGAGLFLAVLLVVVFELLRSRRDEREIVAEAIPQQITTLFVPAARR